MKTSIFTQFMHFFNKLFPQVFHIPDMFLDIPITIRSNAP